jgi:hypothetical protein
MTEEIKIIDEALSLFSNDERGVFWKSKFVDLKIPATKNNRHRLSKLAEWIDYIIEDIGNIGTIIHRLNWHRSDSSNQEFLEKMWLSYASIDIEHFHIEIRSIMDYVARILGNAANKPGKIKRSFRKIYDRRLDLCQRERLGEDFSRLVDTAEWFPDLRNVRDKLTHSGDYITIFGNRKYGILFQVLKGHEKFEKIKFKNILGDYLMFNPNVIYFERYAAIFLSNLFVFLDRLAILIYEKYQLQYIERGAGSHSAGFSIIVDWMKKLKEIIEKSR